MRSTAGRECWEPDRADGYARRRPEETLLYALVREHWPRFLERAEEAGGLPWFVGREFEEYLRCGLLEHGVVRLACRRCGHEMRVGFSCKRRGFCPSCVGRRMSDVAAHLVDEVLPEEPIRQWVCSLPWSLRYALAYDRRLCADVLAGRRPPSSSTSSRLVLSPSEALAEVGGVNIHAKVVVDGRDRKRLERLCRYVARQPRPPRAPRRWARPPPLEPSPVAFSSSDVLGSPWRKRTSDCTSEPLSGHFPLVLTCTRVSLHWDQIGRS